jgi:hypothetical protein
MTDASIFGDVIYSYGDDQAVEDGMLVAVSKIDRVTVAVWGWLQENMPLHGPPPQNWTVPLLAWVQGDGAPADLALAAATGLISEHGSRARKVYDENIGGGVYQLWAEMTGTRLDALWDFEGGRGGTELWLIPNEVGGMTLMFPSDY